MKKKLMLAMAIIMLLGSVKAMAADEMVTDEARVANTLTKTEATEADQLQVEMMDKIREQITVLKENSGPFDEVKVLGKTVSAAQALGAAETDFAALSVEFRMDDAQKVSSILADTIKPLEKHKK